MRTGIFGKIRMVAIFCGLSAGLSFGFSSLANADECAEGDTKCTSGFQCVGALGGGPFADEAACTLNSADNCVVAAQAACTGHGGLASHSCESCNNFPAPTDAKPDTCPTGWYSRMWYTCAD